MTAYPSKNVGVGQTVDFTSNDSSGDIAKAQWDLDGNGSYEQTGDNVKRRYDKAGSYLVKLKLTDRKHHTATATITITVTSNRAPVAVLDMPTQIEVGKSFKASATRSSDPDGKIVAWYWDLNGDGDYGADGSSRYFTYDTPGDYYAGLRVKDNDGNVSEVHVPVHVYDHPDPVSKLSCDASSIPSGGTLHCHADDSASPTKIVKHEWDMNDDGSYGTGGNDSSYTYSTSGWYTVHLRVTDVNGRRSELSTDIQVTNRAPSARITLPAKVVVNQPASFGGGGSSDPDGTLFQWEWDWDGDGFYDALGSSASTTFTSYGQRRIGLRVTDNLGATAVATTTVNVLAPPVSVPRILTATPLAGTATSFDPALSYDPDGRPLTVFQWDFDGNGTVDRTTTTATPVTKTYSGRGSYTAKLTVTDADGLTGTATVTVSVN
ncbi:MAG TPA: PKD domain-containing protein [Thermoleophilaceae bacterium]